MIISFKPGTCGKNIAESLNVRRINATEPTKILPLSKKRRARMSVYVNWGCSPKLLQKVLRSNNLPALKVLNANNFTSSKLKTFDMLEGAGLPFPEIFHDPRVDDIYKRGKYLGRKDGLKGGAGIDIYERGQLPPEDTTYDFFSKVISKQYEVRLHTARNGDGSVEIICEQIKYVPAGSGVLIRNYANGARFSNKSMEKAGIAPELAEKGRNLAVAALDACGMDFAAIDMCLSKRGDWYIFELNSAPGISALDEDAERADPDALGTHDAYVQYFNQFIVKE